MRWYKTSLVVDELEKVAIVSILATMEQIENAATRAVVNMQVEVSTLSKVVLQNLVALDLLTAC